MAFLLDAGQPPGPEVGREGFINHPLEAIRVHPKSVI